MEDQAPPRPRAPKRRRALKVFAFLVVSAMALVAAAPSILSTTPARLLIVQRINQRLAPGSVSLDGLALSWSSPSVLSGLALRDAKGKVVLAAKSVRHDRSLLGLLKGRPNYGAITIEGATVDVERRGDGSIDLMDALATPLKTPSDPSRPSNPHLAVVVKVKGGTLKVASPELVEPIAASSVDGTLTIAPGRPLEGAATLGDTGRSIEIKATFDHRAPAGSPGNLVLNVTGKEWPIHIRAAGMESLGRYQGAVEIRREAGLWVVKGSPSLRGFEAFGPALAGDRLALDRLGLACDLGQTPAGWMVRRLDVASAVASLKASGSYPATGGAKLRARVDLAALAKSIPRTMRLKEGLTLDRGTATILADLSETKGVDRVHLTASLDHLAATQGGRPLALQGSAHLAASASRAGDKVVVEKVELKAAGVDLTASGDLDAGVKLQATVDLATLDAQARQVLDLGKLAVSGRARLGADYRRIGKDYKGRIAAECADLDVVGLTAEPIRRPHVRFDGSASGPMTSEGMPEGWHEAKLDLAAGDVKFDLVGTHQGEDLALTASGGIDVASPSPGRAEAKASLVLKGRVVEVHELRAGISPSSPTATSGTLGLAVRGRLDLASGEGHFEPLPGARLGAVGLKAEGLKVSGLGRSDVPLRVDAAMEGDLAATDRLLAAWSGSAPRGLGGLWSTQVRISRSGAGRLETEGHLAVANIIAPGLRGPFSMGWKGAYVPEADRVEVVGLDLASVFGKVGMSGNLYEVHARKIYDLTANVEPRWETLDPIVAASIEPGAWLRGTFKPIHWKGFYKAETTAQLLAQQVAEVELDVNEARAFGVTLAPTPLVLRMAAGNAVFDPVKTTANGGAVTLIGNLAFDEAYGVWLRLQPGTKVEGMEINDAVSTSVLAYVAPVLAQATQVSGKVSVDLQRASLPITANGSMAILGRVVFDNAQFQAGPLGSELASVAGQPAPKLTLHQPVQLQVAGGRVKQTGLEIPLMGEAKVGLEGSVGFDKTLDLHASIPLSTRLLRLDPRFEKAVQGARVDVPIRGTMSRPAIDQRGLSVALGKAAKAVVGNGLKAEAEGLLDQVVGSSPIGGETKGKPGRVDAIGELEKLGRGLLDRRGR